MAGFIEQTNNAIPFSAFFRTMPNGFGKTGLVLASALVVDVYSPTGSLLATNQTPQEIGGGLYIYTLSGSSTSVAGEYSAIFKTTDTSCFPQHVSDTWSVG